MQFRRAILQVACATVLTATVAQAQVVPPTAFIPSPVGAVISVGYWIYNNATSERVYVVEVRGEGRNTEEARQNGFRVAVESAVGSILASESQSQKSQLSRDDIIMYSSGFIERYEIIKQEPGGLGIQTTMRVWVRRNPIAGRLLNASKTAGEVNGTQSQVSFNTLVESRQNGDRLVNSVIADLAASGFNIQAERTRVELNNSNRTASLLVPYTMSWNRTYLDSLWAALNATQTDKAYVTAVTVRFSGLSMSRTALYADDYVYRTLISRLYNRKPQIELTLVDDQNQVVYRDTFPIRDFNHSDHLSPPGPRLVETTTRAHQSIQINGNVKIRDTLLIENLNPDVLGKVQRAELRII